VKDEDPNGLKLLASPDPLERAAKLLSPLSSLATENIDVWIAMYDVAIRRSRCKNCNGFTILMLSYLQKNSCKLLWHLTVQNL
jgi:hypothetical protein